METPLWPVTLNGEKGTASLGTGMLRVMREESYEALESLLARLESHSREICQTILQDNYELFKKARGSQVNHQAWNGGYMGHVTEVMNISVVLYDRMNSLRPLPFSLSDALLILFLHDIEKPWRYELIGGELSEKIKMDSKSERKMFRDSVLRKYGLILTEEQNNAMKYVEGEMADYSPRGRVMNELAAFCHMCDVASARIWFDYPDKPEATSWAQVQKHS